MSARDDLLRITVFGATSAEQAEQRIDAYRAEVIAEYRASFTMTEALDIAAQYRKEVLRETAQEIRRWADAGEEHLFDEERCGAHAAADHVDPDIDDRRSAAL